MSTRRLMIAALLGAFVALAADGLEAQTSPKTSGDRSTRAPAEGPVSEDEALQGHPGFFDFESPGVFTRDDLEIHISVKGPMLQLVAGASRESEPELSDMLGRLKGIEVRVYSLPEDRRAKTRDLLDRTAGRLKKEGWKPAITVQVQRDHGYAFLRYGGSDPVGLTAMYITDENQAVFVNIVGTLDTATIGRLARRFDLDLLAVSE